MIEIAKWNETFENADTRKRQRLGWLGIPTGCDSNGYLTLVAEEGGFEAFGIFLAICQWSATQPKHLRGKLVRSNENPLSEKDIAIRIRAEVCQVSAALKLLKSNDVGWLKETVSEKSADDLPPKCQSNPDFVQVEVEGEVEGEDNVPTGKQDLNWKKESGFEGITEKDLEAWREAYPACNIQRQLASANQWLLSNPAKAKKKQWRRFITGWLSRSQEKGGDIQSNAKNSRHHGSRNIGTANQTASGEYGGI